MIKMLSKTAKDYRFEDWGERVILEGMRRRAEEDVRTVYTIGLSLC